MRPLYYAIWFPSGDFVHVVMPEGVVSYHVKTEVGAQLLKAMRAGQIEYI